MQLPIKNIYIYSAMRGLKDDAPVCLYVIEDDVTKESKAYRRKFDAPMTGNQLALSAALAALNRLERRSEVHLYTDSIYLVGPVRNGWLKDWKRNGWKNAKEKPVANRELWKQIYAFTERHVLSVEHNESSSVYMWMKWRMEDVDNRGDKRNA